MSSLVLDVCVTLVLFLPLFSSIKGERSSEFLSATGQTVLHRATAIPGRLQAKA